MHQVNALEVAMANILVVDDEEEVAESVRRELMSLGHSVVMRTDSRSIMGILQGNPKHFQLLITDWYMPILNGIDLIKSVALFEELDDLKIILQTSEPEAAHKALSADLRERARVHAKDRLRNHFELLKLVQETLAEGVK